MQLPWSTKQLQWIIIDALHCGAFCVRLATPQPCPKSFGHYWCNTVTDPSQATAIVWFPVLKMAARRAYPACHLSPIKQWYFFARLAPLLAFQHHYFKPQAQPHSLSLVFDLLSCLYFFVLFFSPFSNAVSHYFTFLLMVWITYSGTIQRS